MKWEIGRNILLVEKRNNSRKSIILNLLVRQEFDIFRIVSKGSV